MRSQQPSTVQTVTGDFATTNCILDFLSLTDSLNSSQINSNFYGFVQSKHKMNNVLKEKMLIEAFKKIHTLTWPARDNESGKIWLYYRYSLSALNDKAILDLFNKKYLDPTLLHACREFPSIAKLVLENPEWKARLPKSEIQSLRIIDRITGALAVSLYTIPLYIFRGISWFPLTHYLIRSSFEPLTKLTAKGDQIKNTSISTDPHLHSIKFYNSPKLKPQPLSDLKKIVFALAVVPALLLDVYMSLSIGLLTGLIKGLVIGAINGWRRGIMKSKDVYGDFDLGTINVEPRRVIDIAQSAKENSISIQSSLQKKHAAANVLSTAMIISRGIEPDLSIQAIERVEDTKTITITIDETVIPSARLESESLSKGLGL